VERLPPEACGRDAVRYVLDVHIPFVGNALLGMKETIERLQEGILEAGEDAGDMRLVAQRACAALESAEVTVESGMRILDAASLEIRAAGKE